MPFNAVPWGGLVGRKAFIVVVLNGAIGESHCSDVFPLVCVQSVLGAAERGVFAGATGALEDFLGGRVCVVVPNCPVNFSVPWGGNDGLGEVAIVVETNESPLFRVNRGAEIEVLKNVTGVVDFESLTNVLLLVLGNASVP